MKGMVGYPEVGWRSQSGDSPLTGCPSSVILAICGVFTLVLAKHSKAFSLTDYISVAVDRMERNF
jgi:hypothetical protein